MSAKVKDEISPGGGHTPTHSKELMGRLNTINLTRTPCFSPCSSSEGSQSTGDTLKCLREYFPASLTTKSLLPFHCHSRSAVLGGSAHRCPEQSGKAICGVHRAWAVLLFVFLSQQSQRGCWDQSVIPLQQGWVISFRIKQLFWTQTRLCPFESL